MNTFSWKDILLFVLGIFAIIACAITIWQRVISDCGCDANFVRAYETEKQAHIDFRSKSWNLEKDLKACEERLDFLYSKWSWLKNQ